MMCELIDLSPRVNRLSDFRDEAILGLLREKKSIPPKFFYDEKGSRLFERICEQPEYYPTRTEKAILDARMGEIAEALGTQATLIEFGSGASVKTRLLLDGLADLCAYVPIDISREMLLESARALSKEYRGLPIMPIWADYTRALNHLERVLADHSRKALFFPGSTIGNMEPSQVRAFLAECAWFLSCSGQGGKMLIGFDLVKETAVLEAAYNDRAGMTAAFNLNLLERMNRELEADFDLRQFRHRAFFNRVENRIEMHLESLRAQMVRVAGRQVELGDEELLHTENSYKYSLESFTQTAVDAGFECLKIWTDEKRYFAVALLECRGRLEQELRKAS